MKTIVELNSINNLEKYIKIGANAFIFGLDKYSINNFCMDIKGIKTLLNKYPNIELFISMNKNIFNKEIKDLKQKLIELSKLNIKGILYYDLSILNIKIKNNLKLDLVWNQTHMVTNYNTCNYYYDKGVKYGYISSELTIDEIIEINKKSKMEFMSLIVGYPIMSHSKRKLLTNYFKSNNKDKINKEYIIEDNNKSYFINENNTGTSIIYGNIINGTSCLKKLIDNNFSYVILKEEFIDSDIFIKVLELTINYINTKNENILNDIEKLIGNDTNFFYKKTIYKVKKNEKN